MMRHGNHDFIRRNAMDDYVGPALNYAFIISCGGLSSNFSHFDKRKKNVRLFVLLEE